MNIELHIFTNSTVYAPKTEIIEQTYNSFNETFGKLNSVQVWYDPKPIEKHADKYEINLKKLFPIIHRTTCLADGYIKSVKNSNADYLFMLEHDWVFNKENINHTLSEICKCMEQEDLFHFRFNKRKNIEKVWDRKLTENTNSSVPYCLTPSVSNNPHIIHRKRYVEKALPHLKLNGGSYGIEQELLDIEELKGAIYGLKKYPQTVTHLDGRNR